VTTRHTLKSVLVFEGRPEEMVALHPDETSEQQTNATHVWRLDAGTDYWLECHYFKAKVVIMARVPAGTRQCAITWAHRYRDVTGIACK
jgi:hypothetical protein